MIRQMMRWMFLSGKRALKRPVFLLLLFILPLGSMMFRRAEEKDDGRISIALFTDGDEWNEKVAEELMENGGSFRFYLCGTQEELEEDVASGHAECGYSFGCDLHEKLLNKKYKRAIQATVSPSTTAAELASETVFAGLFRVFGRELLETYVSENGEAFAEARMNDSTLWEKVEEKYDLHLIDGSTFAFQYEQSDGGLIEENEIKAVFPVRGIAAVFIFVMGLGAAVTAAEDEERGFYKAVTGMRKRGLQMISVCVMVFFSCLSVMIYIVLTEGTGNIAVEVLKLLIYGGLTAIFCMFFLCLVKKPVALAGFIPFFILGSMVTCPVFADLSAFIPILKTIRQLFLPWYYMSM